MDVSIADAKARFADLIRRAEAGESITVTRHGKPVAEIVAASPRRTALIGALKGRIAMAEDFDATPPGMAEAMDTAIDP